MKELICIVCPKGCHLKVSEDGTTITGNACPRGEEYGRTEMTNPTRVLTSTVRCIGGTYPRCPVKTERAIPKELLMEAMAALDAVELTAPVRVGQTVLENLCGTGVRVIATRNL